MRNITDQITSNSIVDPLDDDFDKHVEEGLTPQYFELDEYYPNGEDDPVYFAIFVRDNIVIATIECGISI